MIFFGNLLLALIGTFLLIVFAWWFFNEGTTISTGLGTVCVGLILWMIPNTLIAAIEDIGDFKEQLGRRKGRNRI